MVAISVHTFHEAGHVVTRVTIGASSIIRDQTDMHTIVEVFRKDALPERYAFLATDNEHVSWIKLINLVNKERGNHEHT